MSLPYKPCDRITCPEGHTGTVIEVAPESVCVQCDGGDCDGYWYLNSEVSLIR